MPVIIAIAAVSGLFAAGRLTIPGHDLTGWPGSYETMAHFWEGSLLTLWAIKWLPVKWIQRVSWFSIRAFWVLAFWELYMFLHQVKGII